MSTRFRSTSFVTVSAGSLAIFGRAIDRFGPRDHGGLTFGHSSVIRQTTGPERGKSKVLIDAISESDDLEEAKTAAVGTVEHALKHVGGVQREATVETVAVVAEPVASRELD